MKVSKRNIDRLLALACLAIVAGVLAITNACRAQDSDGDGISDQLEQRILENYRPWLYYDHDEPVWPCSAAWFVQHSRLIGNPSGDLAQSVLQNNPRIVLQTSGNYGTWTSANRHSSLKLDVADGARRGPFAGNPALSVSVPIYGHVVQLSDNPEESSLAYPGFATRFGSSYIAVQYWILFPYNDAHFFDNPFLDDPGDHEGDWVWIDVLLNRINGAPQYVVYHHHGDGNIDPSVVPWANVEKRDGAPVIYLEKGTHELWPTAGEREVFYVEPHFGNGQRYRPTTVVNLGEAGKSIAQPSTDAQLDCDLALLFNGLWGDFTGEGGTTNPDGPVNQKFPIFSGSQAWPVNVYVDFGYSGPELGTSDQPFSHLSDAVVAAPNGGAITIRTGISGERLSISKPCTINAAGGIVTIGQ